MKANDTINYTKLFQMPDEIVTLSTVMISYKTLNDLVFTDTANQ